MGTPSRTIFEDYDAVDVVMMYVTMGGDVENYGLSLIKFLNKVHAHDINCLTASVVSEFKTGFGGTFLYPVGSHLGAEYEYRVSFRSGKPYLRIYKVCKDGIKKKLVEGTPSILLKNLGLFS